MKKTSICFSALITFLSWSMAFADDFSVLDSQPQVSEYLGLGYTVLPRGDHEHHPGEHQPPPQQGPTYYNWGTRTEWLWFLLSIHSRRFTDFYSKGSAKGLVKYGGKLVWSK